MTTQPDNTPLLKASGITKRFPGVVALGGVELVLHKGEMLALVGENGAGKSTLMKILAGVQPPDEGEIRIDGKPTTIRSVRDAMALGIALIHQELNLADNLSVAANIFLGREPKKLGLIDTAKMNRESISVLRRLGLTCPPTTLTRKLSIGQQQLVEIAKALSIGARVLIMDEPTSSLSHGESERLFEVIRDLKKAGVSIIYISHRLPEVIDLADRVTVFRDGQNAGHLGKGEITRDNMVRLMVGRDIKSFYPHQPLDPGPTVLKVDKLISPVHPGHEVSFEVRAGEIVGMAGLVGAGRSELIETIFGARRALGGSVTVGERTLSGRWTQLEAIRAGLALCPEDRKLQGLVLPMSVRHNTSMVRLPQDAKGPGFIDFAAERAVSANMVQKLRIKTPHDRQVTRFLSGGNQQKVVIGKWLATGPKVLILDEPTRGIDVGAKEEIYRLMHQLAEQGEAVLFISSEMEEVMGMADRVLVMHEGRLSGILGHDQITDENIMQLATGGVAQPQREAQPA